MARTETTVGARHPRQSGEGGLAMREGARRIARCAAVLAVLALPGASGAAARWTPTNTIDAPSARGSHTEVWTGSKMVVWGGYDGSTYVDTGGIYDPRTDSWMVTSTTDAPLARTGHTAVWTGTKMIVWGGVVVGGVTMNSGGIYDPATDTWAATSTANAPSARHDHTAVWTGSRMIVWGGSGGDALNTGGIYDPATDTWIPTSVTNAPVERRDHTAVWTGSKMIVWGGDGRSDLDSMIGGIYNPATDSWVRMTRDAATPMGRSHHTAVWTGSKMVVWGGYEIIGGDTDTGGIYDPATDRWAATSTVGAPSGRYLHTAVWTGSRMVAWGGIRCAPSCRGVSSGGIYNPATDTWAPTTGVGAPSGRGRHTAVWTGTKMIIWGGWDLTDYMYTGGFLEPASRGDFDGDGNTDILWHNQSTGQLYAWLMDGTIQSSAMLLTPSSVNPVWQARGIVDLDGDGTNDILWHNQSTGALYVWLMNGTVQSSGAFLTPASVNPVWQVQGLADFNSDGKPDILWRHKTSGQLYVWFMNGTAQSSASFLTPSAVASTAWQVRGLGDFNADGKPDILWHNQTSGQVYVWFMNGTALSSTSVLTPSGVANTSWRVAQVADFNGDGKPDILWRNQTSGQLYVWLMNGTTQSLGTLLTPSSVANLAWQISPR